ncbi:hypothetical protein AVEN_83190-1 [Araneus ventricosus]|uniref:Uncharacterized protein n=1 Tax=Araneus ventricosus TaxID=182803 RepID=A0A4Y2AQ37_ARAVE|nr:hypothetical protein AVEN_83190-1 [Araneus ventricosus]
MQNSEAPRLTSDLLNGGRHYEPLQKRLTKEIQKRSQMTKTTPHLVIPLQLSASHQQENFHPEVLEYRVLNRISGQLLYHCSPFIICKNDILLGMR